jgi:hypothetical protein
MGFLNPKLYSKWNVAVTQVFSSYVNYNNQCIYMYYIVIAIYFQKYGMKPLEKENLPLHFLFDTSLC